SRRLSRPPSRPGPPGLVHPRGDRLRRRVHASRARSTRGDGPRGCVRDLGRDGRRPDGGAGRTSVRTALDRRDDPRPGLDHRRCSHRRTRIASGAAQEGGEHLMVWLFLILAIVLEVGAALSLRLATGGRKPFYIAVVVGYLGAFFFLTQVLALGLGIGVAYGIWAASGVALTAVASKFLFKEPFTWVMALGIALIIGGV